MCGICKTVATMKKIMNIFVLVAAAAMALVSCQKNEMDAPAAKKELHFTIKANAPQTKTVISDNGDKTYTPSWKKGDEIGIYFTEPAKDAQADATFANINENGPIAEFDGTAAAPEEGVLYAFYPESAINKAYDDGTIRLDLSTSQKPTSTSFDPACDILVAQPCEYLSDGETVVIDDLHFARIMSVLRINLNSTFADVKDEVVESVSFAVQDVDMAGNAKVDYKTGEIVGWNNGSVDRNVITASYTSEDFVTVAGENNSVYLVVAPVEIPAGKEITFTIETQNYTITKTVAAPAMEFNAGKVEVINLTILAENCEKEDTSLDYSGEYLIAGKEGDNWYAAKKYTSGNYLAVSEIEFIGENIVETEAISDHYMTITKVVGGVYDGMYTIVDAGGKYLATSSSDSNNMKAESSASANTYWTIVKDDAKGTYSIVASKSEYTRNDMRFNYNGGTNSRVSCYDGTKTTQPYLALFSTSLVKQDTTPKLELGEESIELTAAGGEGTIAVTAKNLPAEIQVKALTAEGAQGEVEWLAAAYADGVITYTAQANESTEARTAYIEVYVSDDLKTGVSVTQEAAGVTKQYYVKVTTAPNDWSGTYLIVAGTSVATAIDGSWLKYATATINDNKIEATATTNAYAVTIQKVASQSYYTIKLANGQYLGTPNSNSIKQSTSVASDFYWKFSVSSSLVKIEANSYSGRILRLNGTSGFRTYTSSTGTQATLYRLEGSESGGETPEEPETPVEPDPTPDPDVESVTVTLNPGDSDAGTWVNSQKTSEASVGNVTFTALGTGGNDSKYYDSDKTWRFYTANSSGVKVSVPTGSSITKVVITVTKGSPSTPSGCTVSSANKVYTYTVSNSPTELSFFKSGSDNLQINKIEVTYTN